MGLHGFAPISPLSAAYTLVSWADDHGRFPRATECRPAQGLHHWNVYYRTFCCSTFSSVVSCALDIVSAMCSAPSVKMRQCLGVGCDARFVDQGPSIRLCQRCRKKRGVEDSPSIGYDDLRRWGVSVHEWREDVAW